MFKKIQLLSVLACIMLFVCGCQGGGGGGSLAALSGLTTEGEELVQGGGDEENNPFIGGEDSFLGEDDVAKTHQPEPMTVMLFGSGMLAAGYLKRRKK